MFLSSTSPERGLRNHLVLSALPGFIVVVEVAETEIREEKGFAQDHTEVRTKSKAPESQATQTRNSGHTEGLAADCPSSAT